MEQAADVPPPITRYTTNPIVLRIVLIPQFVLQCTYHLYKTKTLTRNVCLNLL